MVWNIFTCTPKLDDTISSIVLVPCTLGNKGVSNYLFTVIKFYDYNNLKGNRYVDLIVQTSFHDWRSDAKISFLLSKIIHVFITKVLMYHSCFTLHWVLRECYSRDSKISLAIEAYRAIVWYYLKGYLLLHLWAIIHDISVVLTILIPGCTVIFTNIVALI